MLSAEDKLAEIKRLYYRTTAKTVQEDLTRALDLLKSMHNDEERERAAVYMDGLAQMRSDWKKKKTRKNRT
jgi:hypothetical protein